MAIYLPELSLDDMGFPPVVRALKQPDGLLAMGGDLSQSRLIKAYSSGIFPWFSEGEPILWWSPSIRAVFKPDSLVLNRSLRKVMRRNGYTFSLNRAFIQVIKNCAAPRAKQSATWIVPQMQQAYINLHKAGYAHSVEVWQQDSLVGGLYGVQIGGLFCGESMFNLQPDTAKLALIVLQQHLQHATAGWIDCQIPNPFLRQLGATAMSRSQYIELLQQQATITLPQQHWQARTTSLDNLNA